MEKTVAEPVTVYSIRIIATLCNSAAQILDKHHYGNKRH